MNEVLVISSAPGLQECVSWMKVAQWPVSSVQPLWTQHTEEPRVLPQGMGLLQAWV